VIDYWNLTRPRIVTLVLAAMLASALTATETVPSWSLLLHAMLGTTGIIVGAIAMNQRLEHRADAIMPRTAGRPLPSNRLSAGQVTVFSAVTTIVGTAYLIWFGNAPLVILAIFGWLCYVAVYTPLKKRSIWQTPIGAVAGAMPAVLGAAAAGAPWSLMGWTIFGIVFCWQFPHAMAIAWLYRDQFEAAGIKVATVVDPSGKAAGWFALFGAILLPVVSVLPLCFSLAGWTYAFIASLLALIYLACSVMFFKTPNEVSARRLLRVSLFYLPLLLIALVTMRNI